MTESDNGAGCRPATGRRSLLGAAALMAAGAGSPRAQQPAATPFATGAGFRHIGTYDLDRLARITGPELTAFMASSTMPAAFAGRFAPPRHPVSLYQVAYRSSVPEFGNRPTLASGLVAVPETDGRSLPVLSYQHGTVFDRSFVPSNPEASMETRLMLAAFAAQGYVVIGADYFGRGLSDLPDSYLVRRSTQQANLDMLLAARDFLSSRGIEATRLFLSGWSQGGWVTMQHLRQLEAAGLGPRAAAVASAPVDIYLTMNRWMSNPQPVDAVYLPGVVAIQLLAQASYHRQDGLAEAAIRPDFVAHARALHEGRMDWETFFRRTTPKLADFIRPDFAASGFPGDAPYWQILREAEAYHWRSSTPLRVYVGGRDEVTPLAIGHLPEATQRLLGGAPVQTIDAGAEADHRAVFVHGVLDQKPWFDAMLG
ncbi:alpha/beta hydrolase family protein [Falsiroseomonas sp. CW058]|uniref:alpha/beta hydrolase family protein n=1 Tax=Falsiroseomonas sp. CW058 TaxID=3388664 RepID=UPI003D3176C8